MSAAVDQAAGARLAATNRVNVAASAYETARARVQRARSELGTATSELAKAAKAYTAAAGDLVASLPDLPEVERELGLLAVTTSRAGELELAADRLARENAQPEPGAAS